MKLARLGSLATLLVMTGTAHCQIGSPGPDFCETSDAMICFDFDSTSPDSGVFFGHVAIRNDLFNGYLSITDNVNWNQGTLVFPTLESTENLFVVGGRTGGANSNHHLDNIELDADGEDFRFAADLRMGGGTLRPADGFSVNFARPEDPVIQTGDGWSVLSAHHFPEEGTTTGLAVGFDEWTNNGPGDIVGISVRYDDELLAQFPYETLNGHQEDSGSLQTVLNRIKLEDVEITEDNQTSSTGIELRDLGWERFEIERAGNTVTVSYKGNEHIVSLTPSTFDCNNDGLVSDGDIHCATGETIDSVLAELQTVNGDFNLDRAVDFADFLILSDHFGTLASATYQDGDTDLNGVVEFADFLKLADNFGFAGSSDPIPVPEPSSLTAFALGLLLIWRVNLRLS